MDTITSWKIGGCRPPAPSVRDLARAPGAYSAETDFLNLSYHTGRGEAADGLRRLFFELDGSAPRPGCDRWSAPPPPGRRGHTRLGHGPGHSGPAAAARCRL